MEGRTRICNPRMITQPLKRCPPLHSKSVFRFGRNGDSIKTKGWVRQAGRRVNRKYVYSVSILSKCALYLNLSTALNEANGIGVFKIHPTLE